MMVKRLFWMAVVAIGLAGVAQAQPYTPFNLYSGGVDPHPTIYSVVTNSGRATVSWTGFRGGYEVQVTTNAGLSYTTVGATSTVAKMISFKCPASTPNGGFRITAPTPRYNSAYGQCGYCHGKITRDWVRTPHAGAFESLPASFKTNSACLPCHTVGYGLSTGFINTNTTRYFAGVQCENCHGPTGGHAGKYNTPAVTLNSKMCGGCHNGEAPQYDEWTTTFHGKTTNMLFASTYLNVSRATSEARMGQCGPCHAGAVRLALLKEYPKNALPTGSNVVEVGTASCDTCHDPHSAHNENGGVHLRNPSYSTNATVWSTTLVTNYYPTWVYGNNATTNYRMATTNFWLQYNPNIMICGQCHQARNTDQVLTGTSPFRNTKPHYSHVYNMNAANIGTTSTNVPMPDMTGVSATSMRHGINTNGETCTMCHMGETEGDSGHTFEVKTEGCYQSGYCHEVGEDMEAKIDETQLSISNAVIGVKGMLDTWAATYSNPAITNIPGKVMVKWEYSGNLSSSSIGSNPTNAAGTAANQQDLIPVPIRQARQNLYLIWYDGGEGGSMGVHNPEWTRYLINVASNLVLSVTP
jgi:hypothetical protein